MGTHFVNLKTITISEYQNESFDFSLLPKSLKVLTVSSTYASDETKLVNEISLKRLPYPNQLEFYSATLNASFIPSSLQTLVMKTLTSQEDLVGTNITSLTLHYSRKTPLEFIPSRLLTLTLFFTELRVIYRVS